MVLIRLEGLFAVTTSINRKRDIYDQRWPLHLSSSFPPGENLLVQRWAREETEELRITDGGEEHLIALLNLLFLFSVSSHLKELTAASTSRLRSKSCWTSSPASDIMPHKDLSPSSPILWRISLEIFPNASTGPERGGDEISRRGSFLTIYIIQQSLEILDGLNHRLDILSPSMNGVVRLMDTSQVEGLRSKDLATLEVSTDRLFIRCIFLVLTWRFKCQGKF